VQGNALHYLYRAILRGYSKVKANTMKTTILDILAALTIAAGLTVCALAYFDVLVK
jgi:hypothetical protein